MYKPHNKSLSASRLSHTFFLVTYDK